MPIHEGDLEQDWKPRPLEFRDRPVTCLAQILQAANAYIAIASTESIAHRSCLYYVVGCVDEVGTRLASYQDKPSLAQKHLRQRRLVLHALCELHEEGQETLTEGRAWLDQVQQDHSLGVLTAKNTTLQARRNTPSQERRLASIGSRANVTRCLRLVRSEEPCGHVRHRTIAKTE